MILALYFFLNDVLNDFLGKILHNTEFTILTTVRCTVQ